MGDAAPYERGMAEVRDANLLYEALCNASADERPSRRRRTEACAEAERGSGLYVRVRCVRGTPSCSRFLALRLSPVSGLSRYRD